jgi:lipid-A-disaccharide synthase
MSELSKAPDGAFSMAMVAGETSGDLLAGLMLQGIRAQWPNAYLYGIGGPTEKLWAFAINSKHNCWPNHRRFLWA